MSSRWAAFIEHRVGDLIPYRNSGKGCARGSMSSATFTHSSRMEGTQGLDVDRFVDRVAG
jgi:hypothetical protein